MDTRSIQHAFVYNSNTHTFTWIPDLVASPGGQRHWRSSQHTVATGINDQGIVVGFYSAENIFVDDPIEASDANPSFKGFVFDSQYRSVPDDTNFQPYRPARPRR